MPWGRSQSEEIKALVPLLTSSPISTLHIVGKNHFGSIPMKAKLEQVQYSRNSSIRWEKGLRVSAPDGQ